MAALEALLGYRFSNAQLLQQAMAHSSRAHTANNQRLEFLGDAILGAVVAEMLYHLFPQEKEGELARRHAALVRGETLVQVALQMGLGEHISMASSEVTAGGRSTPSNLEDALEALIGALYLDGGLEAAKQFILPRWQTLARSFETAPKDAKTALQEWAQARGKPIPVYTVLSSEGPAHAPLFTVQVEVEGIPPMQAQARSKRLAEQLAAGEMLERLG